MALLSLIVALPTEKKKITVNSQTRSFSLMLSYEKCGNNRIFN